MGKSTKATKATTTKVEEKVEAYVRSNHKRIVLRRDLPNPPGGFSGLKPDGEQNLLDFMESLLLGGLETPDDRGFDSHLQHILDRVEEEGTEYPQYVYIIRNLSEGRRASISKKSHLYKPLMGVMFP